MWSPAPSCSSGVLHQWTTTPRRQLPIQTGQRGCGYSSDVITYLLNTEIINLFRTRSSLTHLKHTDRLTMLDQFLWLVVGLCGLWLVAGLTGWSCGRIRGSCCSERSDCHWRGQRSPPATHTHTHTQVNRPIKSLLSLWHHHSVSLPSHRSHMTSEIFPSALWPRGLQRENNSLIQGSLKTLKDP